jgi:hypothetical protein
LFALGRKLTLGSLAVLEILGLGVALYAARRAGVVGLAASLFAVEAVLALATGWALVNRDMFRAVLGGWRAVAVACVAFAATLLAAPLGAIPQVLVGGVVYLAAAWLIEPAIRLSIELLRAQPGAPPPEAP